MPKLCLALLIVLSVSSVVGAQNAPRRSQTSNRATATEPFQQTFKTGTGCALHLTNVAGDVRIVPGTDGQIEAKAMKRSSASTDAEARQQLSAVTINARSVGSRVEIEVENVDRNRRSNNVDVEFDVKVPSACAVEAGSVSGNVTVTNVKGEVRASSVSGGVTLDSTPRLTSGTTVSGDIRFTNAGGDALELTTVSGNITGRGLASRTLELSTVSGETRITDWAGDRASWHGVSGNLDLAGSLAKGGRYDFETHSGDVHLTLADQPGFELEAQTFSGDVRVDFSMRTEGTISTGRSGRRSRSVRSTYGDGSSSLHILTFSGDIVIAKR